MTQNLAVFYSLFELIQLTLAFSEARRSRTFFDRLRHLVWQCDAELLSGSHVRPPFGWDLIIPNRLRFICFAQAKKLKVA